MGNYFYSRLIIYTLYLCFIMAETPWKHKTLQLLIFRYFEAKCAEESFYKGINACAYDLVNKRERLVLPRIPGNVTTEVLPNLQQLASL